MRSGALALIAALLCFACAAVPGVRDDILLTQADAKLAADDHEGAIVLYDEFAAAKPAHAQAARARATRTVLERLAALQADLERGQRLDETPRLRRDLSDRQSEIDRLKSDGDRLKREGDSLRGEVNKLRADLERLRTIDLQQLRPDPKK